MLQSMTGYGKSTGNFKNKKITVEMRALNSKGVDIYMRLPTGYKKIELPIRKKIQKLAKRGKIECFITEEVMDAQQVVPLNKPLIRAYYKELSGLASEEGADVSGILAAVLRIPEINKPPEEEKEEEEYRFVQELVEESVSKLTNYRLEEGASIKKDFIHSVGSIQSLLSEVKQYEEERIKIVRERLDNAIKKEKHESVDKNRLEQEFIYYIEKMDINEEKKRLQQHIDYFLSTMEGEGGIGKKLGFIAQEMGREINTLGSKSYHADMQRIVVNMKDHLEKIKEQVLNTL